MSNLVHIVVYTGTGEYQCANCGEKTDKEGMAKFMAGNCPAAPDIAGIYEKLAKIAESLDALVSEPRRQKLP